MNSFVILYDYVFVTQKKGLFGRRAGRSKAVLTKPEDMEGVCVCVCVCVCMGLHECRVREQAVSMLRSVYEGVEL